MRYLHTDVNNALNMETDMAELKQIGPRIREDVYDALHEYSADSRMSMSLIVELALKEYLKSSGYEFANDNRD